MDLDRITRRFAAAYESAHQALVSGLRGRLDESARRSQAADVLNRLILACFVGHSAPGDSLPKLTRPARGRVLEFAQEWEWRLTDDLPAHPREITPDVLGLILEQRVNQRQTGSYYTRADVTRFIAASTLIPAVLDGIIARGIPEKSLLKALRARLALEPLRYVRPALLKGVVDADGVLVPLPPEGHGIHLHKSGASQLTAEPALALPDETGSDSLARRTRCLELVSWLRDGRLASIDDIVTWNLDGTRLLCDLVSSSLDDRLANVCRDVLAGNATTAVRGAKGPPFRVLDPTCGSGAFLVAALEVLEPLYAACLKQVNPNQNGRYRPAWIRRTIVNRNLYGVDLLPEAVAMCRLRLKLKIVAATGLRNAGGASGFEDVRTNVVAGDALAHDPRLSGRAVSRSGLAASDFNWRRAFPRVLSQGGFDAIIGNPPYVETAAVVARPTVVAHSTAAAQSRDRATTPPGGLPHPGSNDRSRDRHSQGRRGRKTRAELGIGEEQDAYGGLQLARTGNLFALCAERSLDLLCPGGRLGLILPMSAAATPRMRPLMELMAQRLAPIWLSHFACRPGKLFVGVDMNVTIVLGRRRRDPQVRISPRLSRRERSPAEFAVNAQPAPPLEIHTTGYQRWSQNFRPHLFDTLHYAPTLLLSERGCIPKLQSTFERRLLDKLLAFAADGRLRVTDAPGANGSGSGKHRKPDLLAADDAGSTGETIYVHSGGRYFRKCLREKLSNEYKPLVVPHGWGDAAVCLLSSSLFYWLWIALSDCYHVTDRDLRSLPLTDSLAADPKLSRLARRLTDDLWANAQTRARRRADGTMRREVNFDVSRSKPLLDEIDRVLARHFGLTEAELEFILQYDARYRCPRAAPDESDCPSRRKAMAC